MRIYRNSVYVTGCITLISAFMSFAFHYWYLKSQNREIEFWCNVALAIFGSGSSVLSWAALRMHYVNSHMPLMLIVFQSLLLIIIVMRHIETSTIFSAAARYTLVIHTFKI